MKKRITALILYALYWLLFFFFARLFFILSHPAEAFQFSAGTLAATFFHGLKLDMSATGYILVFPLLVLIPALWIKGTWYSRFVKWFTWIIVFVAAAITVSDTVLYKYWGFRMDYTPLLYLKTPGEAAASVTTMTVLSVFSAVIILTVLFVFLYKRFVDNFFNDFGNVRHRLPAAVFFLVLWASLIIPIRGGTGIAPINAGTVYFSKDMFVNHAAINVLWNVGSSAFNQRPTRNPYEYGELDSAKASAASLTISKGVSRKVLNNTRPNILLIILESFGNSLVGALGGDPLTTPRLNSYVSEGILFSNFYSSGNRTDKALPAILSGYPAQPAVSIIKEPQKTQSLNSMVRVLKNLDYQSSFWYGGDINFANFKSFVIASGFDRMVTMENFNPKHYNSKWGVHDHVLFESLKDSMKTMKEPFFRTVLTLSSHEPFEVPMEPVFEGRDGLTKFRNSVYYTDSTAGDFLEWAKRTDWWENTLVILVSDHCRRNSPDIMVYSQEIFRIPMLWLGGAVSEKGLTIDKFGSQVDIPVTLLNQMGISADYKFGKDLLSDETNSFAFYTFNEGFAFITDTSAVIFDHKLQQPVYSRGRNPELTEILGKSYLQVLFDDYLKR